ncbi:MAG: nucleotide exchange factor GrpE [Bacteroidetes bacterium]|nr:nucleotide exchange factor GrpE [Bacteroidota bacterium]MBS1925855.1 nucleotide exchange factor GrpE [Bacteroidota bacterium]MCC6693018.1 nucleotide exchange factor GrpE [Chitinophagaceae bacterium]
MKDSQNSEVELDINSDAEIPGKTHLNNPMKEDDAELATLTNELETQKDKYLRLFAEFDNYKRRTAKERVELIQTAGKDLIINLLDILDDVDRAEKQMETTPDALQVNEGNQLIFTKLKTLLQQKGLKEIQSLHTDFDVEKHEAVSQIQAGEALKGKVVDVLQKGYYLNDKLIRFAKVVVGN